MPASPTIRNAFSINVEDWFQGTGFTDAIPLDQWDLLSSRVETNLIPMLELLAKHQAHATFFVLGWIADRHPSVIRRIAAGGHEVASLGYGRLRVDSQTPAEFRDDLICSKALLEDLTGHEVYGYRAPSFSIGIKTPWAHSIIAESGYRYSSSVYPIQRGIGGVADSPRFSYRALPNLLEIPVSLIRLFGHSLPGPGGGFFRLYPYRLTRWAMNRLNHQETAAAVYYCQLWEIDPEQPKLNHASLPIRAMHNLNLGTTMQKIDLMLGEFRWGRIDDIFADELFGTNRSSSRKAAFTTQVDELPRLLTQR